MAFLDAAWAKGVGPSRLPWCAVSNRASSCCYYHTRVDRPSSSLLPPSALVSYDSRPCAYKGIAVTPSDWSVPKRRVTIRLRQFPAPKPKKKPASQDTKDATVTAAASPKKAKTEPKNSAKSQSDPSQSPSEPRPPADQPEAGPVPVADTGTSSSKAAPSQSHDAAARAIQAAQTAAQDAEHELSSMARRLLLAATEVQSLPVKPPEPFVPRAPRPKLSQNSTITLDSTNVIYSVGHSVDPAFDHGMFANDAAAITRIREDFFKKPRRYVAVVLDADNLKFKMDLVRQGFKGGMTFYRQLAANVSKHLELNQTHEELATSLNRDHRIRYRHMSSQLSDPVDPGSRRDFNISLRLYAFCNLQGLSRHLVDRYGISHETFADFRRGISTSSPWSIISDAGKTEQAADFKVKAFMLDMLSDVDCFHLYLGGLNDSGYANELDVLKRAGLLAQVSLLFLPGPVMKSKYYAEYAARVVQWTDCFDDEFSLRSQKRPMKISAEPAVADAADDDSKKQGDMDAKSSPSGDAATSAPRSVVQSEGQVVVDRDPEETEPAESKAAESKPPASERTKKDPAETKAVETPAADQGASGTKAGETPAEDQGASDTKAITAKPSSKPVPKGSKRSSPARIVEKETAWVEAEAERVEEKTAAGKASMKTSAKLKRKPPPGTKKERSPPIEGKSSVDDDSKDQTSTVEKTKESNRPASSTRRRTTRWNSDKDQQPSMVPRGRSTRRMRGDSSDRHRRLTSSPYDRGKDQMRWTSPAPTHTPE